MELNLIANRYKPLFTRARGGFGAVEVAWDTRLMRRVAIKRIPTARGMGPTSLEEARTLALLANPHIVEVHDLEQLGGETLIVMENVDGPSLTELLANSTELLDLDTITALLDGVMAALECAHENGVLHLDIKPANILITQQGHVKVSDFGLAELGGSGGFGTAMGGTIGYMPPEQLMGGDVDVRSDLWAFATLAYQLLTGCNPFFALSISEAYSRILNEPVALPSALRPELSAGVDEALVAALAAEPQARPESVTALWALLKPHLGRTGVGRRRLKSLAGAWSGQEAAQRETQQGGDARESSPGGSANSNNQGAAPPELEQNAETSPPLTTPKSSFAEEDERLAARKAERLAARTEQRAARRSAKGGAHAGSAANAGARHKGEPLWERLGLTAQALLARLASGLGAGSLAWLALSALHYLGSPLNQAASAATAGTLVGSIGPFDAAFALQLAGALITGVCALIVPRVGAAVAVALLSLGFYLTGNWLLGNLVLAAGIAWWLLIARHSATDATVFTLAPLFTLVGLPLLLPLIAGYFQEWRRALGTAAFACVVCALLSLTTASLGQNFLLALLNSAGGSVGAGAQTGLSYGLWSGVPTGQLLAAWPALSALPQQEQLFAPLASLLTQPGFWCILAAWIAAAVAVSLLANGHNRVKYLLALLVGSGILAAGYILPLMFGALASQHAIALIVQVLVRLAISCLACVALVAFGAPPHANAGTLPARSTQSTRTRGSAK